MSLLCRGSQNRKYSQKYSPVAMGSSADGSSHKMEWMYGGAKSLLDHEKYLLGQKVDKNFEIAQSESERNVKSSFDAILSARVASSKPSGFQVIVFNYVLLVNAKILLIVGTRLGARTAARLDQSEGH